MSLKKPSEKRFRVPSSEDEEMMHVGDEAGDAMMLKVHPRETREARLAGANTREAKEN